MPQPANFRPRLRHCTFVLQAGSSALTMVIGTQYFEIHPADGNGELFLKAKRYFDGRHTIAEISQAAGVDEDSILTLVEQFSSLGLLHQPDDRRQIPAGEFCQRIKDSCFMWSRQIGYHALFRMLENGKAQREVFLGLLVETYHYVNAAAHHIGVAIAHCRDADHRRLLEKYLAEEADHGPLVLRTLENLGVAPEHVAGSHPTIGTLSLINMLCEIGRQSSLAYLAGTSLVEARREDAEQGQKSLEAIAGRYGLPAAGLAPLIQHRLDDLDAGHEGLLEEALRNRSEVSSDEAHLVANCLHDLKHSFDQFHDQILHYYSTTTNYVPRLKVDYFAL